MANEFSNEIYWNLLHSHDSILFASFAKSVILVNIYRIQLHPFVSLFHLAYLQMLLSLSYGQVMAKQMKWVEKKNEPEKKLAQTERNKQ